MWGQNGTCPGGFRILTTTTSFVTRKDRAGARLSGGAVSRAAGHGRCDSDRARWRADEGSGRANARNARDPVIGWTKQGQGRCPLGRLCPHTPTKGRRPLDSRQGRALGTHSLVGVRERGAEAIGSIHRSGGRCWNGLRGRRRRRCWWPGRRSRRWRTGSVAAIHAGGHCYRRFGWNPASPRPGIDAATLDIRFAARVAGSCQIGSGDCQAEAAILVPENRWFWIRSARPWKSRWEASFQRWSARGICERCRWSLSGCWATTLTTLTIPPVRVVSTVNRMLER